MQISSERIERLDAPHVSHRQLAEAFEVHFGRLGMMGTDRGADNDGENAGGEERQADGRPIEPGAKGVGSLCRVTLFRTGGFTIGKEEDHNDQAQGLDNQGDSS